MAHVLGGFLLLFDCGEYLGTIGCFDSFLHLDQDWYDCLDVPSVHHGRFSVKPYLVVWMVRSHKTNSALAVRVKIKQGAKTVYEQGLRPLLMPYIDVSEPKKTE
mmetsp:Transcript_18408/g.39774  ORF Transcript_18408/g.39774 Transcript_18408/m.39774 type:complete len:104 (+) Transcript_18408:393-704(+)